MIEIAKLKMTISEMAGDGFYHQTLNKEQTYNFIFQHTEIVSLGNVGAIFHHQYYYKVCVIFV